MTLVLNDGRWILIQYGESSSGGYKPMYLFWGVCLFDPKSYQVPILLCTVLDIYQIYTSIHLHTHLQSEQRLVLFALMSQFDGSHNNYNISYRNCIDTILNLSCTIAIMGTFHISKYDYTSNTISSTFSHKIQFIYF